MSDSVVLCACYCLLSLSTYFIWPSRWNLLAHFNVGFCLIAYVIPIIVLHYDRRYSAELEHRLAGTMAAGTASFIFAMVVSAVIASWRRSDKNRREFGVAFDDFHTSSSGRRLMVAVAAGIVFTCFAGVMMRELPLFAADPYAAKYFRGDYQVGALVSLTYRIGTGLLTVLLPLSIASYFADRKQRAQWLLLNIAAIALMVATLQRGSMANGILIVVASALIMRRRTFVAIGLVIGSYIVGAVFYAVLGSLGLEQLISRVPTVPIPFWQSVAAGVPDVSDTLSFFTGWVAQGEPITHGMTIIGGLVPGHYQWNPAVWSLQIQNFGVGLSDIWSGGLRMPLPLWGLVSFGTIGVVCLSAVVGALTGYMTKRVSAQFPRPTVLATVVLTVLLQCGMNTLGSLEDMSYLSLFEAIVVLWVVVPSIRRRPRDAGADGKRVKNFGQAALADSSTDYSGGEDMHSGARGRSEANV